MVDNEIVNGSEPVEQIQPTETTQQVETTKPEQVVEDISSLKSQWAEKEKSYETTLREHQERLEQYKKYESDYFTLVDSYTGKGIFANDTIRKQNEILKKFPDKDPSVVSSILSKDFNSLSDSEALILADKLTMNSIPGVNDNDRLEGILDMLGLSGVDLNSLEGKDKYKFQVAVSKAKQQLSELANVQVPENNQFDIEAIKKARTEHLEAEKSKLESKWNPVNETLLKAFDGYKQDIKDEKGNVVLSYKYLADDNFKQEYASELKETLLSAGLEPTQENYQLVYNLINREFSARKMDKIINDVYKQLRTKMEEEYHAKIHNDKPTQTGLNQSRDNSPTGKTLREWATQSK